jgi:hypothetical protein
MMKKIVGYVGLIMSLTWVSQAATRTWTNDVGDATGRFSVPANWAEGVAPVNNDLLVFGPTPTANTTLTNDLPIGTIYLNTTTFNSDAPAYTIGGNNLTGNSGTASPWTSYSFVVNSANNITQTINNNITAHQNAIGVSGSGNLTLGGDNH